LEDIELEFEKKERKESYKREEDIWEGIDSFCNRYREENSEEVR